MSGPDLQTLASVVGEEAASSLRRLADRAANEARGLVEAAEAYAADLERAARELGEVRGRAVADVLEKEADEEIASVRAGAFDRLCERFEVRVRTALDALRDTPRYEPAVRAWAAQAARVMDGPADVFAAPEDRARIYEALLEAGARDFQVHVDRDVHVGFVVRDLDGRTILDRRPAALIEEHRARLRDLLAGRVPPALPPS